MSTVALLECRPRRGSDGAVQVLRLVWNSRERANFLGQQWYPGLLAPPTFETILGFDGTGYGKGASPTIGSFGFVAAQGLEAFVPLVWKGATIKLWTAPWLPGVAPFDPADAAFTLIATGYADTIAVSAEGVATVAFLDPGAVLDVPVQPLVFGTSGVALLDGTDAVDKKGQQVPLGWGELLKIPGLLVDKANLVYVLLGNAATSVQGFYDGGAPFTLGAARASLAALQANVPAHGAVDYCLNAGGLVLARPWDTPTYPFTADLTVGSTKAADIVSAIVASRTALGFVAGAVAAFNAAQPAPCQLYVDDDRTVATALDQLLIGLGGWWELTAAGSIDLRRWAFAGAPATTIHSYEIVSIERNAAIIPTGRRTLGYAKIGKVHGDSDIAKALDWTDVTGTGRPDDSATGGDNLLPNSLLLTDTNGWNLQAWAARAAASAPRSTAWCFATTTGNPGGSTIFTDRFPVAGGRKLWFSAAADSYGAAGLNGTLYLVEYSATGANLATTGVALTPSGSGGTWDRFEKAVTLNAATTQAIITLDVSPLSAGRFEAGGFRVAYTQAGADVTALNTPSLTGLVDFAVTASYTGVIDPGQLPLQRRFKAFTGTTDVSASSTFVLSGVTAGLVGNVAFDGSDHGLFTWSNGGAGTAIMTVTFPSGAQLAETLTFAIRNAAAPSSGGGGGGGGGSGTSTATATSFGNVAAATYGTTALNTTAMQVVLSAGQSLTLSANLSVDVAQATPLGNFGFAGRMQYKAVASSTWIDTAEFTDASSGNYPANVSNEPPIVETGGQLTITPAAITGLAATTYDVRVIARTAGSGSATRTRYFTGSATAVAA